MATSSIGWLGSSPEWCNAAVTSFDLGGLWVKFLHSGGGFDSSWEGELYCNLQVKSLEKPFQQGMVVSDSELDREEREGGDVFVESWGVLPVLVEWSEGDLSLCCCVIGGECGLKGFLDLGPGLVCISNTLVFELGEPSFSKGFSSSLGHSVEENHGPCWVRIFVLMEGEIGLHSHEPSVGISGFSTEFFKESCFNFHVVIFFVRVRIYSDGGMGETRGWRVWGTERWWGSGWCWWIKVLCPGKISWWNCGSQVGTIWRSWGWFEQGVR